MTSQKVVDLYVKQCPSIREPEEKSKSCFFCKHCSWGGGKDICKKHNLTHNWNEPVDNNFANLTCDDFEKADHED